MSVIRSRASTNIDDLVRSCDPLNADALSAASIDQVLDEIGGSIVRLPHRRPAVRKRHRRMIVAVAAAVIVVAGGVAAGAVVIGAHTGLFPSEADRSIGGPGEELNPAAPDFRAVALQVTSDIPYPTGYRSWRDWVLDLEAPAAQSGGPDQTATTPYPDGLVSSGALRGYFAASAFCAWLQSWRQATIAGDSTAAAAASQMIAQAPTWPAVSSEDPHPDPAATNDPGAETGSLFGWMLPYRAAVLAGDRARVEQLLASGYGDGKCWLNDPQWIALQRSHGESWGALSPDQLAVKYEQFLQSERP